MRPREQSHSQALSYGLSPRRAPLATCLSSCLTSGSVPSVFHTLMKVQSGMQSMEDRAMSQPMP